MLNINVYITTNKLFWKSSEKSFPSPVLVLVIVLINKGVR